MSVVSPNTSRPAPPEPAPGVPAPFGHEVIAVESPGKEDDEEKNQDKALFMDAADGRSAPRRYAIVCDGTSSSPYAAAAAEYVSGRVREMFQEGGVGRVAESLNAMRLALLDRPLKPVEGQSELLRSMFEEIVRKKYRQSFQTTFAAVCLKRAGDDGAVSVKAIACGDSALFVFRGDGELVFNNLNLGGSLDPFKHGSPITRVLPDSYGGDEAHVLFEFREYPRDTHLLLCSDGLYDGFANFREIYDWLNEHRPELGSVESRAECLSELHRRLNGRKGDDDISFIWLRPPDAQEEPAADAEEEAGAGRAEAGGQSFFTRARVELSRWWGLFVQHLFRA